MRIRYTIRLEVPGLENNVPSVSFEGEIDQDDVRLVSSDTSYTGFAALVEDVITQAVRLKLGMLVDRYNAWLNKAKKLPHLPL